MSVLLAGCCVCLLGLWQAQSAFALPDGRAYEMVSPTYKGGYGANAIKAVGSDGDSVAFASLGAFAGVSTSQVVDVYVARRGASGWSTAPVMPPAELVPFDEIVDFSQTLGASLSKGKTGVNYAKASGGEGSADGTVNEFLFHQSVQPISIAGFQIQGSALETVDHASWDLAYRGASADFSHIVFTDVSGSPHVLLPEAMGTSANLYELVTEPPNAPLLRLVALDGKGDLIDPSCPEQLGVGTGAGSRSVLGSISSTGNQVIFTQNVDGSSSSCSPQHQQVFARLGGATTLELSKQLEACAEVPCAGAEGRPPAVFQGASSDGSRVFFSTIARLDPARDSDEKTDLYMAKIGCPSEAASCDASQRVVTGIEQVSHDSNAGEAAEVQGVVSIAPDGSHVYFVARGSLSVGPNAEGALPVSGADNLYVADVASGGEPSFIGDLCSGPETSGERRDASCPATGGDDSNLWMNTFAEAQASGGDGRFLVFSTYARLVANDVNSARDVYLYDAETGALYRVSIGEAGFDANGNGNGHGPGAKILSFIRNDATVSGQAGMRTRAVSEDGSSVVFESAERLSEKVVNGLSNVYEWHLQTNGSLGEVAPISTGSATEAVNTAVITPSGHDVFFVTTQGLVPQDTDGASDVYDARVGGGFLPPPAPRQPCSGDACQGPLSTPAPVLIPGSRSQAPGGNVAPPAKAKSKPKIIGKKKGKRGKASARKRTTSRRRRT